MTRDQKQRIAYGVIRSVADFVEEWESDPEAGCEDVSTEEVAKLAARWMARADLPGRTWDTRLPDPYDR